MRTKYVLEIKSGNAWLPLSERSPPVMFASEHEAETIAAILYPKATIRVIPVEVKEEPA